MSINAKTVVRVIIEGEWIWVERGTFTVVPFDFVDDDGNNLFPSKTPAYFFISTNGDPYYGPLSSISLMKLDAQMLEETDSGPKPKGRPHALGPGDGSAPTGGVLVSDGSGATRDAGAGGGDDAPPKEKKKKKPVPLFADDVVDDDDEDDDDEEADDEGDGVASGEEEPVLAATGTEDDPDPTEPTAGRRRSGGLF